MVNQLVQNISVVGINQRATDDLLTEGTSTPQAAIVLDLSERPNQFWTGAFYSCWAKSLERDAAAHGQYTISNGSTLEERKHQLREIFNLRSRLQSPKETYAPWFRHPNTANENEPSQIGFSVMPVVQLYGSVREYMQRLLEAVDAANEMIPNYPALLVHAEKLEKEKATRESIRAAVEKLLDEVRRSLASKGESLVVEASQ